MSKDFSSIREILEFRKRENADKTAVTFLADGEEKEERLTFAGLHRAALRCAAGLQARGIGKGDRVLIMLPTGLEFLSFLFGTLIIGAVPVPAYPPFSWNKLEHYLETLAVIVENSEARLLITFSRAKKVLGTILKKAAHLEEMLEPAEIQSEEKRVQRPEIGLDDLALIQYTSGSTSTPKGVMITHRNILSNIRNIGEISSVVPEKEIGCSWLPVYHDISWPQGEDLYIRVIDIIL